MPQTTQEQQQFFQAASMADSQQNSLQAMQKTPTMNHQTPPRSNMSSPHSSGGQMNMQGNMIESGITSAPTSVFNQTPTASAATIAALQQHKASGSMNPPSAVPTSASQASASGTPTSATPASPQVGGPARNYVPDKREKERVDVLLKINLMLVQAAVHLQSDGKGCDLQQMAQKHNDPKDSVPDDNKQFYE
jgi:hypothetical protein